MGGLPQAMLVCPQLAAGGVNKAFLLTKVSHTSRFGGTSNPA